MVFDFCHCYSYNKNEINAGKETILEVQIEDSLFHLYFKKNSRAVKICQSPLCFYPLSAYADNRSVYLIYFEFQNFS